jgi:hypothetical protein
MKFINVDDVSKLGTTIGTGSSVVISILALDLYMDLPYSERGAFVILIVVLAFINIASTTIASFTAKYSAKQSAKAEEEPVQQKVILVKKSEENEQAMTDTWKYK